MADTDLESSGLAGRLGRHLPAKIAVWLGLAVGICVPYFSLQRLHLAPIRSVPATPIDAWVGFWPALLAPYLSVALLVPLAPLLAADRDALRRYGWGLFWLCAPCFAIFALFPVHGPRPDIAPDHPLYRWLVSVDRPSNSLPSLHAGLTVYSLAFAFRVLRGDVPARTRALVVAAGSAWGALILYSTLATKQHWLLDLPPAALLALLAHGWAWRDRPAPDTG